MTKSIEMQGRTEEEAIENALAMLGLSRDDVSVEIIETAKTGLFGLKNTPAVVKVEYEEEGSEDDDYQADDDKANDLKASGKKSDTYRKSDRYSAPPSDELCERVDSFLKGLFERMDIPVTLEVTKAEGMVKVTLAGSDPGVLIGRRGETLDALQHLTNYAMNRSNTGRTRINLDAENYRQRRSDSLESLAQRTASKVIKYRRNMTLDPMNAYERHIIHSALQDHEQVSTYSVGKEQSRRVVIAYGQGKEQSDNSSTPQYKEWR
ncbi:MAG: protein jag [Oscillospiraceae bacterium]|nr:protein jag [Oscillospiraceae bacterium]